jgi:hypothetical protein
VGETRKAVDPFRKICLLGLEGKGEEWVGRGLGVDVTIYVMLQGRKWTPG